MSVWENLHFIRPWWLLLLPVVMSAWWIDRKSDDALIGWRNLIDHRLLNALTVGGTSQSRWRDFSKLLAGLLAVLAIAGPTWRLAPSPFADDPIPLMVVLRAGESMNTEDLVPNRMERARLKISDLAEQRKGQPLGLIAYSATAHLVLPPTRDTAVVATMAAEISPEIMPKQGDDLAASLQLAAATLGDLGGSVIVIADTIASTNQPSITAFGDQSDLPIAILAVTRDETPELDSIRAAASSMDAKVFPMTPDSTDIQRIVRWSSNTPVAIAAEKDGNRWAESGWWLVPVIAAITLLAFRREEFAKTNEALA